MPRVKFQCAAIAALSLCAMSANAARVSFGMNFGEETLVAKYGDVALRAQCIEAEGGTTDRVRIYATIAAGNGILQGTDNFVGAGSYLTNTTMPADAELHTRTVATTTENIGSSGAFDNGFVMSLETGKGLAVNHDQSVLGLNPSGVTMGVGTTDIPGDCIVSVNVDRFNIKRLKKPLVP